MTKIAGSSAWPLTPDVWIGFAPMVGRIAGLDPTTPVRLIQRGDGRSTAMAALPSGALVDRTIAVRADPADVLVGGTQAGSVDVTARAGELARWLGLPGPAPIRERRPGLALLGSDVSAFDLSADVLGLDVSSSEENLSAGPSRVPERADAAWRGGLPPTGEWTRVDTVPGEVVRDLVRQGAQAHLDAADQGLGARAADALLDLVVLTVTSPTATVNVTNRSLSALSSMGFLPVGGNVVVSVNRGWTRVAAEFGSAYAEPVRHGLVLL